MAKIGARELVARANAEIETLSVEDAVRLHDQGEALFVDVRERHEREQGTVPGSLHLPRGSLEFYADPESPMHKPELDAGKKLVLFCGAGGRSALAAKTLKDMGYKDVAHVAGGFGAWSAAGGKVER